MKKLLNFFKSSTDLYFTLQYEFNPADIPNSLIQQLTSSQPIYLAEFLKKAEKLSKKSTLYRLKVLTILALLFLHSGKFYQIGLLLMPFNYQGQSSIQDKKINNEWLDEQFVKPFQQYLMKCCSSYEFYHNIKNLSKLKRNYQKKYYNFDNLYYIINLIKKLNQSLEKIAILGRYYQKDHPFLTKNFIFTAALHLVQIYNSLKIILNQMLSNPKKYLQTTSLKGLMKNILLQQLNQINQSIKTIILNKYFNPYGSGIKVSLFTCDNQKNQVNTCIQAIIKDQNIVSTDRQMYIKSVQEMKEEYSISRQALFSQTSNNFTNSLNKTITLKQIFQQNLPQRNQTQKNQQVFFNNVQEINLNKRSHRLLKSFKQKNSKLNNEQRKIKSKSLKNMKLIKKNQSQHINTLEERDQQQQNNDQNYKNQMKNIEKHDYQKCDFRKNKNNSPCKNFIQNQENQIRTTLDLKESTNVRYETRNS